MSDSFQHAKQLRLNASDCHATGAEVCSRSVERVWVGAHGPVRSGLVGSRLNGTVRDSPPGSARPQRSLGLQVCWRYLWWAGPACHDRAVSDTS